MSLVGLDIGTTGCRVIVFDVNGKIMAQAAREYSIVVPKPNWAEQDAGQVYVLAVEALREACALAHDDPPIAMALSCQGEAVLPVDADGNPLRPVILGMDTRTTAENDWLRQTFGEKQLFERTGMPVHTINTLPKLLWLKTHEPELWQQAHQFLLYEDFFIRRFTGRASISHCMASRTQMYDLATGAWATDILRECGIPVNKLARLAPLDGYVGTLAIEIQRDLGLSEVKIFAGGHDQACAALGSGVMRPGMAMVSTGTAEVVEVAMAAPVLTHPLRRGGISVYKHVVPGLFLAMTLNHSGGLSLRWFRDQFGEREMDRAKKQGGDAFDFILKNAKDGPTNLFVLPHFSGSGTPSLDTQSKGAIVGLTFGATKADVAKAILEGLTFELKSNIDLLRQAGISIDSMHAVGGGAKSDLWLRLKADICNVTLNVPEITEAACLGAAILAGVGAGAYADFYSALHKVLNFTRTYEPDEKSNMRYSERYQLYQKIYPALQAVHHSL